MDPSSLGEVLDCVLNVGAVTGTENTATSLVDGPRHRLEVIADSVAGESRPRTFALEWSDPPFNGGHWVPEMIEIAGGEPVLTSRGTPSVRVTWEQIASASPEVVVFMPCGYDLEGAVAEATPVLERDDVSRTAFFAVDASAYFSRPGPRLVDGVEILASALHPEAVPASPPGTVRRLR
jgi:iron complex transport system substrate-binding protein